MNVSSNYNNYNTMIKSIFVSVHTPFYKSVLRDEHHDWVQLWYAMRYLLYFTVPYSNITSQNTELLWSAILEILIQ